MKFDTQPIMIIEIPECSISNSETVHNLKMAAHQAAQRGVVVTNYIKTPTPIVTVAEATRLVTYNSARRCKIHSFGIGRTEYKTDNFLPNNAHGKNQKRKPYADEEIRLRRNRRQEKQAMLYEPMPLEDSRPKIRSGLGPIVTIAPAG